MANVGNYFESLEHCVLDGVSFGLYSSVEIKKLSVLKLTTPLSFDSLGHPIPGGLYDRVLGPSTELDKCSTCGNIMGLCPGHLGYIELPVPVIHPLFYNSVLMLLKLSCRSCSAILIPENLKRLLLNQLKLLDLGLIVEAYEAESTLCSALSLISNSKDLPVADAGFVQEQLDNYVEKSIKESMLDKVGTFTENRNVEQLRNIFISNVLKQMPSSKKCTTCKSPITAIKKMGGQIVMSLNRVEIAPKHSDDRKTKAVTKVKKIGESVLMPQKIRDYLRQIWQKEKEFLKAIFPILTNTDLQYATDLFFLDTVTVTPPCTRPIQIRDDQIVEPPYIATYKSIIQDCMILRNLAEAVQSGSAENLSKEVQDVLAHIKGSDDLEKLHQVWQELQSNVDHLLDKDMNKSTTSLLALGVKQVLEKKEGLFRMHMMGKRVNYAARTVITPDPNIDIDEIGVPKAFALKLTYPVPVTPWNAEELRRMVLNGPNVHPGACMVQNEDGSISKLKPDDFRQRSGVAKRLLTPPEKGSSGALKVVYRHLCNGDVMLLNRQPTLHRPSIMAHRARVLSTEKTFRLHYANCKSYNADFDGDEMNAHFPQNEISRSEGYNLASVSNHYLVPKDGTPLSGLIQDHVIAGVKLSVRGRFFNRSDYQHLVFQALTQKSGYIKLLPPAIWKPEPLWSGKQIISTVIINVTPAGKSRINLHSKAKIGYKDWETAKPRSWRGGGSPLKSVIDMSEAEVIIRKGELLSGILDKNHYGATPYGLVHCMNELYGGSSSLSLLSCFSKLFGAFLQIEGFTLGVKDILVRKHPDNKRKRVISNIREAGHNIALEALGLEDAEEETVKNLIETEYHTDPVKWQAHLDRFYKESLDTFTNEINKICIPDGLLSRFPDNNLQLMIKSGAKGSAVNAMQISCLLGQIELEGKRPPVMKSGKSLPCFSAFDTSPRAGGFVEGRFMTGIKPQEFFFHCMAGREGLIDTAVKTSRSGYLQRCLVKHLEGLTVKYDLSVRDSDGSIVQFYYGEDGMDISKSKFMNEKLFPILVDNRKVILNPKACSQLKNPSIMDEIREQQEKIMEWNKKFQRGETIRISPFLNFKCGKKCPLSPEEKKIDPKTGRPAGLSRWMSRLMTYDPDERKRAKNLSKRPDPVNSKFRIDSVYGSICENLEDMVNNYTDKVLESGSLSSRRIEEIKNMVYLKSMMSISPPGEPVGLLAAQSVGEPSTQMTLNTFHFAGRGEMNVTLGIPRLREILMVASKNIKTPSMEIPFLSNITGLKKQSENLKRKFARVTMADVLEKIHVKECFDTNPPRSTCYEIRMDFLRRSQYKKKFSVKPAIILRAVEKRYLAMLLGALIKASSTKSISVFFDKKKRATGAGKSKDDENDEDDIYEAVEESAPAPDINDNESSEDELDGEEDPESARKHGRHEETEDYDDPEEEVQQELAEELKEDVDAYEDDDVEEIKLDDSNAVDDPCIEETVVNIVAEETASVRRNAVVSKSTIVKNYVFDMKEELWCELSLRFPVSYKKIDLVSIIKDTAKKCIVQEVPGIKKAITYKDPSNPETLMLKTDGINLLEIFSYDRILDLNKLYSNDIHAVASVYGIEAASKVIVKEITNVFKVYGIVVDPRHLLLIADYMTRDGIFRPMSRKGLEDNISSFQKMTFESSINFLKMATISGRMDLLQSPSSCLSLGIPVRVGTGMFDVLYQLPTEIC